MYLQVSVEINTYGRKLSGFQNAVRKEQALNVFTKKGKIHSNAVENKSKTQCIVTERLKNRNERTVRKVKENRK
jgi:hypothetical protein